DGRDLGDDDADDQDDPDDRSERDHQQDPLLAVGDLAEQQDRRPAKHSVQQLAGETADHGKDRPDDGHGSSLWTLQLRGSRFAPPDLADAQTTPRTLGLTVSRLGP